MTDSPPQIQPPPEVELNAKIKILQESVNAIQQEIRIAQGRVANGDPKIAAHLQAENEQLKARLAKLEKALLSVFVAGARPRQAKDEKLQNEVLVKSVIDYCKKAKVDEQIWKSLES